MVSLVCGRPGQISVARNGSAVSLTLRHHQHHQRTAPGRTSIETYYILVYGITLVIRFIGIVHKNLLLRPSALLLVSHGLYDDS